MNDAEKLDTLATWLDIKFPDQNKIDVQTDLRQMAEKLWAIGGNIPDVQLKER